MTKSRKVWIAIAATLFGAILTGSVALWLSLRIPDERDPRFIGTWHSPIGSRVHITTFSADGTGYFMRPFKWGTHDGRLYLSLHGNHGWFHTSADYVIAPGGKLISLGEKYIGIPTRLRNVAREPTVQIGTIDPRHLIEVLKELANRGLGQGEGTWDLDGPLIVVPKPLAAAARAACEDINREYPGAVRLERP